MTKSTPGCRKQRLRQTALAALVAVGGASAQAAESQQAEPRQDVQAESVLIEIVVTAQRRAENLQKVPISVAAVTAETLASTGINATNELVQAMPAVQFNRSGPSGLFFVRGVGTTNGAFGEEGANAFYLDGVYLPDLSQTISSFNNIERIEVLKGPQGTLFGRNAFGGLVHVITREPGDELYVSGQASYANYQTLSGNLYVAGPLSDTVSMDIALTGSDQGKGWGTNFTTGKENKELDHWGVRSKLVAKPSDGIKLTLTGDYSELDDSTALGWRLENGFLGVGGIRSPGGHNSIAGTEQGFSQENWGFSLTGEFDLGFATLSSISAVRDSQTAASLDVDTGPAELLALEYDSGTRSYQQEFRLASDGTGPFNWQLGVFYLRSLADNNPRFRGAALAGAGLAGRIIDVRLTTDSYAAFGEVSYRVLPRTEVIAGVRFTEDRRRISGDETAILLAGPPNVRPASDRLTYDEVTYRVALQHELTDDLNLYASVNRGFKAGSFNLQSPFDPPVEPQFITAYELGMKSELLNRKLRLNVAAFHYDISDYQVRSNALGRNLLLNAANVKVDGVDLDFEAMPTRNLRIFGGFSWLDSKFDRFGGPGAQFQAPFLYPNPAVCDTPPTFDSDPGRSTGAPTGGLTTCFGDATGNQTPLSPDFTANIGASIIVPLAGSSELRFSTLLSYNDGYPFEPDGLLQQDDFTLLNASIEYSYGNWGVELWGRNLTDTDWYAQKSGTATGPFVTLSAPRQYGVSFKFAY